MYFIRIVYFQHLQTINLNKTIVCVYTPYMFSADQLATTYCFPNQLIEREIILKQFYFILDNIEANFMTLIINHK